MSASASEDGERAAAMNMVLEEVLHQKCEDLEQKIKDLKNGARERAEEDHDSLSASVVHWNMKETKYKEEIERFKQQLEAQDEENTNLSSHKKDLKERRKALEQEIRTLKKHDAMIRVENEELRKAHEALKVELFQACRVGTDFAAELNRIVIVCIAAQARHNRTIAAMSKIFAEQKETESITETERTVIDHCLRQLTNEERAKFLCECGLLDGGFVFRDQIRREMDAIMRDPKRLAELMRDGVSMEVTDVEGPSQEVQKREKRRKKGSRKH